MQLTLALSSSTRRPVRLTSCGPALRTIRNSLVQGDELFDAVVFLAHALEIPALVPGANDWANEVTAEFAIMRLPRSLGVDPDESKLPAIRQVRRAA